MTTRRIVPAEATEEMLVDGARRHDDFVSESCPYPRTKAVYRAMLAASPASGKVTKEEVEKAAEAIWDCANRDGTDPEWNDLSDLNKEQGRNLARAAIASLGLEVG